MPTGADTALSSVRQTVTGTNWFMRIALLDLYTSGHHLKYASALVRYLQRRNHEVMFITLSKDERVERMLATPFPSLVFSFLADRRDAHLSSSFLLWQLQMTTILGESFKVAMMWDADVLHLLHVDTFLPLYLSTLRHRLRTFVSLFWLYSIAGNGDGSIVEMIHWKLSSVLLRQMIRRKVIKGIFIHGIYPHGTQESVKERVRWLSEYQNAFFFLHDPLYEDFHAHYTQDEAKEKLNLPLDAPIFLFFGMLTRQKGLDILLEAMTYVKREFYLVIAGTPIDFSKREIDSYKRRLRHPCMVIDRLGWVSEEDLPYYFTAADAIVMPYRRNYAAGTSGILVEACSARKPVICSDVGTIGQMTKMNSLGIVVPPESPESLAEAISHFLINRNKLSEVARVSAEKYVAGAKWEGIAEVIERAYARLSV